jgi:hypothetical protein
MRISFLPQPPGFASLLLLGWLLLGLSEKSTIAQVIRVTASLETNRIPVGGTTLLKVYAQIMEPWQENTDRIFSWYVDVLNGNGTVARGNYDSLRKTASDNDPRISSTGTNEGAHRRGIYDTFMNLPGAGRQAPVLLCEIPVQGLAAGRVTFRVQPGSGVSGLGFDFIVAPAGGGDPLLGGDYALASATLEVVDEPCRVSASLAYVPRADGQHEVRVSFPLCAGQNHFVEFRDRLNIGEWQVLPNAPHNSGTATDISAAPHRFYRVRVGP